MSDVRIIAVANQKGGVGKTTTVINLGYSLALADKRVLLVDLDPQGNASTGLGIHANAREHSIKDVLEGAIPLGEAIVTPGHENLSIICSSTDLTSADIELARDRDRTARLKSVLKKNMSTVAGYDIILIDCPPSLGLLTINALIAVDAVLVPLQCEFYALEGLSQLILTLRELRQTLGLKLPIEGILLTMIDRRNKLSREVEEDVREQLDQLVYRTAIPRNVRLGEAPSHGLPVLAYDPRSSGGLAYKELADEFLERQSNRREESSP